MLFAQNTVMISSSKRHQCRQNCCQYNKLYFNVKMLQIQCRWGSACEWERIYSSN